MMTVEEMVAFAKSKGASDIHLVCGLTPRFRVDGALKPMSDEKLTQDDCLEIARYLSGPDFDKLMAQGEWDGAGEFANNRCRLHIFKQQGVPSLALRILSEDIPELESLGLPPAVFDFVNYKKGIILVTGETGSGKSTTLAALLDRINHNHDKHIVTLEDPVEYLYTPDRCVINQREVGKDTRSFSEGLRAALREDPDVILIGEMRDRDTFETAIAAAETGHLVFGTLHTSSAADSIDRIVQVFPEADKPQIRLELSMVMRAVLAQQLLPRIGGGRIAACELMIVNDAIRNLIRTGNTPQISNQVSSSAAIGGQNMDQALVGLVKRGQISRDIALSYAKDKDYVKRSAY